MRKFAAVTLNSLPREEIEEIYWELLKNANSEVNIHREVVGILKKDFMISQILEMQDAK